MEALLVVHGDPFAVWADLARQLREVQKVVVPGSAEACRWALTAKAEAHLTNAELAAAQRITKHGPSLPVRGVVCGARSTVIHGAVAHTYQIGMEHLADGPATLQMRVEQQARPAVPASPASSKAGEVPAGSSSYLPGVQQQPEAEVGDPVGPRVNCFSEDGYDRVVVPAGAALVATGWHGGQVTVLELGDPKAALAELRRQLSGSRAFDWSETSEKLIDGRIIRRYSNVVPAGGGACWMVTSPDGRYLRFERHSD